MGGGMEFLPIDEVPDSVQAATERSTEEQIIRDISVEGAEQEPEPLRLYEALKETPLYDPKKEQWNSYMSENQEIKSYNRYSADQLLGILVEATVYGEKSKAQEQYQKLKETRLFSLYNRRREQWNTSTNIADLVVDKSRESTSQLLGIFVETKIGSSAKAQEQYEKLKETILYDEENEQWNCSMLKNHIESSFRSSTDQLLGILVEAAVGDKTEAKRLYEKLKKTPLYDEENEQWNFDMNMSQELYSSNRSSQDQLLGILVEAAVGDKTEAKRLYEKLKKTPLYDEENKQWNSLMGSNQKLDSSNRYSTSQLLGVVVEDLFK